MQQGAGPLAGRRWDQTGTIFPLWEIKPKDEWFARDCSKMLWPRKGGPEVKQQEKVKIPGKAKPPHPPAAGMLG